MDEDESDHARGEGKAPGRLYGAGEHGLEKDQHERNAVNAGEAGRLDEQQVFGLAEPQASSRKAGEDPGGEVFRPVQRKGAR